MIFDSIQYPLTGNLSIITMCLEAVIAFFSVEMFVNFLIRFIKTSNKSRDQRNLALGFFFLAFGTIYFLFSFADYMVYDTNMHLQIELICYVILSTGSVAMVIVTERTEYQKRYIFSLLSLLLLIAVYITSFFQQRQIIMDLSLISIPVVIGFLIFYMQRVLKMTNFSPGISHNVVYFIIGTFLIWGGYSLSSEILLELYGLMIKVIADIITLSGLVLFFFSIQRLPDLRELEWVQKIQALLVIQPNGIAVFSRFFHSKAENENQEFLISGAISTIDSVLKSMVGKDPLNAVKLSDKSIIFEYREKINFVIIADEDFQALHLRLKEFADEFMIIFKNIVKDWNGNMSVFTPAEWLADKIFMPLKK